MKNFQSKAHPKISILVNLCHSIVRNFKAGIPKRIIGPVKSNDNPKLKQQINTTLNSPKEVLSPTINNYVNITTINGPSVPYKIQNSCFLSPQAQSSAESKVSHKKTLSIKQNLKKNIATNKEIKVLMQKKKEMLGVKSASHSKRQSLNTSIDKLFKNKRGSLGNAPKVNVVIFYIYKT